ncbi:MAG: hypothetical protein KDJ83_01630 [Rhodobacteraceae bacterium]|nr:hypothetical protein [Paracoccaceae bacterium]
MNRCLNPGLSRGSVWRALRRTGLSDRRRRDPGPGATKVATQRFEEATFGFVHVDLKYLAKIEGKGEYVFIAVERTTRFTGHADHEAFLLGFIPACHHTRPRCLCQRAPADIPNNQL